MNGETRETSKDREKKGKAVEKALGVWFITSALLSVCLLSAAAYISHVGLTGAVIVWGVAFGIVALLTGVALGNR